MATNGMSISNSSKNTEGILPNAFNAVNNIGKSVVTAANNAVKNVNTAMNNSIQNITKAVNTTANSFANAAKNNLGIKNTGTNIANSLKAIDTGLNVPIQESIEAVPSEGISLGVSLPLILGIGILIIIFVLFVVFRQQIAAGLQKAYDYIKGKITGTSTTPESVPVTGPDVTMETQPKMVPLPPIAGTENVISKVMNARKTVFNVAPNKYTYADAEPICKALGAELATYEQVKKAWDDGADWCNYGWVKGQTAVYPTQQKTFEKLQTAATDDERMSCGLPGVNGGYMDNPELRFGVNCYGDRPANKDADITYKNMMGDVPLTNEVLEQRKKELRFRSEANQIPLNPFNTDGA